MARYESKSVERKALAHLLEYEEEQHEYIPKLSEEDFYHQVYRQSFILFRKIYNEDGTTLDSATVYTRAGEKVPVRQLVQTPTTPAEAKSIFENLKDLTARRKLKRASQKIEEAVTSEEPIQESASEIESELLEITGDMYDTDSLQSTGELAPRVMEYLEENHGPNELVGIPTGLSRLNQIIAGWEDGEFSIIAGRPSHGKSDLMISSALSAAQNDYKVLIYSLEMNWRGLYLRMASQLSGIDRMKVRRGTYNSKELSHIADAIGSLRDLDLNIDDSSRTLDEIIYKTSKLKRRNSIDIVFLDYFGMIDFPRERGDNQQNASRKASAKLKFLTKDLDIPVIIISQLNRYVEHRESRRPRLADLRGTGGLEQDVDTCILLYRKGQYDDDADPTVANLSVAKQRNGPTMAFKAHYKPRTGRFSDAR